MHRIIPSSLIAVACWLTIVGSSDAADVDARTRSILEQSAAGIAELQAVADQDVEAALGKWSASEPAVLDVIQAEARKAPGVGTRHFGPRKALGDAILESWPLLLTGFLVSIACCAVVARYFHVVQMARSSRPYQVVVAPAVLAAPHVTAAAFLGLAVRLAILPDATIAAQQPAPVDISPMQAVNENPQTLPDLLTSESQALGDLKPRLKTEVERSQHEVRVAQLRRRIVYGMGITCIGLFMFSVVSLLPASRCPGCNK